ncbi:SGNH/GDSL hydrolase family protein [Rhodopirellula sp. JC740]|uniref:SGNH/GDSL hydrolase family protein n=1 Tax=Rhodopirellula halodulae TaxID=2894198 RepID=A0ABS8NID6_9BACT|nr:SGNH/GDSL hydrolase family protein [Rhodopirellula sp. JC740]MCC9643325.1 SGNH/GDSL hydrolase family protein [Rhodopirellula sp. JC740]
MPNSNANKMSPRSLTRRGVATLIATLLLSLGWMTNHSSAQEAIDVLSGARIAVVGDSITQAGHYVSLLSYQLQKQYPDRDFDIYPLGLGSETVSGLSEDGHAGGRFPRPCLLERLERLLDRVKPDVIIACYGMNDGIYQPLNQERMDAFQNGMLSFIRQSQKAGVKQIYLVTPPIYDDLTRQKEVDYDVVLAEFASWESSLQLDGVEVIDLHTPMKKARKQREQPFSRDHVHPGMDGHWVMAQTIASGLGLPPLNRSLADVQADPMFSLIDQKHKLRWKGWMNHIGYTREKHYPSAPLGKTEVEAQQLQASIDALRQE